MIEGFIPVMPSTPDRTRDDTWMQGKAISTMLSILSSPRLFEPSLLLEEVSLGLLGHRVMSQSSA
jgi:hypothetical protein